MRNSYLKQKSLGVAVYCRVATDTQIDNKSNDVSVEGRKSMTVQQLEQIAALRQANYPYSFIGRELGLSPNTVKSVCRRKRFEATGSRKTKEEKQNAPLCRYCHKPLAGVVRHGAVFCSDYCRTKWHRDNREIIEIKPYLFPATE